MSNLGSAPRYLWLALLLVLLGLTFFSLKTPNLLARLNCPVQIQQSDAINVERAFILLRGENLYPDSAHGGPYLYSAYPPLYYWFEALLLKMIHNPWMPGRLLAFGGYLGCGLLLGWWVSRVISLTWGLLATLSLWLFPAWIRWGTVDRPDTLFIFFNFAAFLILYWEQKKNAKTPKLQWMAMAGVLNAASVLIKQTSLTLSISYVVYCFVLRDWKRLLAFLSFSFIPVGLVILLESVASHGLFLKHVFFWLHTGYDWKLFAHWILNDFMLENGWVLLLVLLLAALKEQPLLLNIQMFFISMELFSLGREGGAENYWLGFSLFGLFFVMESLRAPWRKGFRSSLLDKKLYWACLLILAGGMVEGGLDKSLKVPTDAEIQMKQEAETFFAPGDSLALDTDLMIMKGQKVWVQPYEYTRMVDMGIWNAQPLIHDIQTKKFKTIELYDLPTQYLLPEAVVSVVKKNYHLTVRKYGRVWLAPNKT